MGEAKIGVLLASRAMGGDKNRIAETRTEFEARLTTVTQYINKTFDVAGLTRELQPSEWRQWPRRAAVVSRSDKDTTDRAHRVVLPMKRTGVR